MEDLQEDHKLDPKSMHELQQFVQQESDKAKLRGAIHTLTDRCFKKCVTARVSSSTLDRSEEMCMQSCVERFMDSQAVVLRHMGQGAARGH